MERWMSVNQMLSEDITRLDHNLVPPGFCGDAHKLSILQESLSHVIDALGEASAAAQGLPRIITTTAKLRAADNHLLYLLKDDAANGGRGEVIGLLKVGCKHLFLFDENGRVSEVDPLCVLDFYVRGDRQRLGHGRMLFDRMLKDAGARVEQLAIDGPSPKMERFLLKNYGVKRLLRQNNNFAIAPGFFGDCVISKCGRITPNSAAGAVGRFAAVQPPSGIASVIHGGGAGAAGNGYDHDRRSPSPPPAELYEAPPPRSSPRPRPPVAPESERPRSLPVPPLEVQAHRDVAAPPHDRHVAVPPSPAESAMSRRDSQLTDQGYFDVKFYHNKLW